MNADKAAPDHAQLTGLVFELASQLHVERAHRLALQALLENSGVIDAAALQAIASDPALLRRNHEALEESVAKLLRVLTESADSRRPLRDVEGSNRSKGAKP